MLLPAQSPRRRHQLLDDMPAILFLRGEKLAAVWTSAGRAQAPRGHRKVPSDGAIGTLCLPGLERGWDGQAAGGPSVRPHGRGNAAVPENPEGRSVSAFTPFADPRTPG